VLEKNRFGEEEEPLSLLTGMDRCGSTLPRVERQQVRPYVERRATGRLGSCWSVCSMEHVCTMTYVKLGAFASLSAAATRQAAPGGAQHSHTGP
jgi:hypothetical protein